MTKEQIAQKAKEIIKHKRVNVEYLTELINYGWSWNALELYFLHFISTVKISKEDYKILKRYILDKEFVEA